MLWFFFFFFFLQLPTPLHLITLISLGLNATVTGVTSILCKKIVIYVLVLFCLRVGSTRTNVGRWEVTSSDVTSASSWSSTTPESSKEDSRLLPSLLLLVCLLWVPNLPGANKYKRMRLSLSKTEYERAYRAYWWMDATCRDLSNRVAGYVWAAEVVAVGLEVAATIDCVWDSGWDLAWPTGSV